MRVGSYTGHRFGAAEHDPISLAQQAIQFAPLGLREVTMLAFGQQLLGPRLFLFGQPIVRPQRVKLLADGVPAPLAGADDDSVCLTATLNDAYFVLIDRTVKDIRQVLLELTDSDIQAHKISPLLEHSKRRQMRNQIKVLLMT